jgi:TRAP-type C4-dicarboxylate transport system permease small subunit
LTKKNLSSKFSAGVTRFSEFGAIIAGLVILTSGFIIVYGVIVRYFFQHPTIWEIELASYLLIGATFAAAPSALHHKAHVSVGLLTENTGVRIPNVLYIITGIFGIVFAIALAERGYQMWFESYENGWRSGSVWGPKLIYPYAIIPIGMIWFAVQYFVEVRKRIRSLAKRDCSTGQENNNDREDL